MNEWVNKYLGFLGPVDYSDAKPKIDLILLGAVFLLLAVGTVEMFSSGAVEGLRKHSDPYHFLKRHVIFLAVGLFALYVGTRLPLRLLERATYPLLGGALLLLLGVLLFGREINGARRWFWIGPLSFQPVEVAKFSLICYLAHSLHKKADKVRLFTVGFVPHLLVCMLMMVLLLRQPDLGSSLLLGGITLTLLFIAGAKASYLLLSILAAAPLAYLIIVGTWRVQRLLAYLNPEAYRDGAAYQIIQSRIAFGSGGPWGVGLGQGRQTLGYMPEAHSDFIMASLGEELGFMGFAFVLGLFALIAWRGSRAALRGQTPFAALLAFGLTVSLCYQAIFNVSAVLGLIPAKGITMPFMSYGGTSLSVSLFFIGLILNVGRRQPTVKKKKKPSTTEFARRRKKRATFVCDS